MRVRITFAKQGALRYTGHLDLHKIWERAARRADLPLAYSQGFHPQPKISLASALPLGFSSRAEVLDMKLDADVSPDDICARLKAALPSGIQIQNVESVDENSPALQTQIVSAEYVVALTAAIQETDLKQRIEELMRAKSLPRERRGKPYDLRPLIEELNILRGQTSMPEHTPPLMISMRLTARQGATGRPEEVLGALGIPIEGMHIERTHLFFG